MSKKTKPLCKGQWGMANLDVLGKWKAFSLFKYNHISCFVGSTLCVSVAILNAKSSQPCITLESCVKRPEVWAKRLVGGHQH